MSRAFRTARSAGGCSRGLRQPMAVASKTVTRSANPFSSSGPTSRNDSVGSSASSTTAPLTSVCPAAAAPDPRGQVHGAAEVVAVLHHHRAGRDSRVGGGRSPAPRPPSRAWRARPGPRAEVHHHPVPQPLHRGAGVIGDDPLHHRARLPGEPRAGCVSLLVGDARVPREVDEDEAAGRAGPGWVPADSRARSIPSTLPRSTRAPAGGGTG